MNDNKQTESDVTNVNFLKNIPYLTVMPLITLWDGQSNIYIYLYYFNEGFKFEENILKDTNLKTLFNAKRINSFGWILTFALLFA